MKRITAFLQSHVLGILLFAVVTGVLGNFVYDWLRSDKPTPMDPGLVVLPPTDIQTPGSVPFESGQYRLTGKFVPDAGLYLSVTPPQGPDFVYTFTEAPKRFVYRPHKGEEPAYLIDVLSADATAKTMKVTVAKRRK